MTLVSEKLIVEYTSINTCIHLFLGPEKVVSNFQITHSNRAALGMNIKIHAVNFRDHIALSISKNRPLRGTRLFLLLYLFRSKKTIARKTISKTKEKSAKVKIMTEHAS